MEENRKLLALRVDGRWATPQLDMFHDRGSESYSASFPTAGGWEVGELWTRSTSAWPSTGSVCSSLLDVLVPADQVPAQYYLTPRACAGILQRAERRGRKLPEPLRQVLQAVAARMTPAEQQLAISSSPESTETAEAAEAKEVSPEDS